MAGPTLRVEDASRLSGATVIRLSRRDEREQREERVARVAAERRRREAVRRGRSEAWRSYRERSLAGGRAWVNGREVGGAQERYVHLGQSHD
jgi:hypothetical protein